MSELQRALELFNLLSIEDVTVNSLKKTFKTHILKSHPDKGGNADLFDEMLRSYMYLTETIQRIMGGRDTLQNIACPEELKEMRPDELINRLFEEFQNEEFNKEFEDQNQKDTHGYSTWLKNKESETNLVQGQYGDATQKIPSFLEKDLNKQFENSISKTETNSIILHPEAMAYISGQNCGTSIIETHENGYTSEAFIKPEYTDVFSAFTSDNTIYDKLPTFTESNKSLDELIAERSKDITPFNDTELQAIQDYEKKKLDTNINNFSKVKEHFMYENISQSNLINCPPEKYPNEAYQGFLIDL